jgi:hypothetical protein
MTVFYKAASLPSASGFKQNMANFEVYAALSSFTRQSSQQLHGHTK